MRVDLRKLKPNPTRDFIIDPIDKNAVRRLTKSIKEDGFWGGVVCRQANGGTEIAAGHSRVEAAIAAGETHADLFVTDDIDDHAMARIYRVENATQRGSQGTAEAGAVASAIAEIAYDVMSGEGSGDFTGTTLETVRGNIASKKGIGIDRVLKLLVKDIPDMTDYTVKGHIANLKASGDYARIIEDVAARVEEEYLAEFEKLEREKKAAEKAGDKKLVKKIEEKIEDSPVTVARDAVDAATEKDAGGKKKDPTFDLTGVQQHLLTPAHVATFRSIVLAKGVQPFLPVNQHAKLAAELVRLAKSRDVEMTSGFIKDNVGTMVHAIIVAAKKASREEQERLLREDWNKQARVYQHEFARRAGDMLTAATKLAKHAKERPDGVTLHLTGEFREAVKRAKEAIKLIEAKIA